jgi:hypothetical protein
MEMEEMETLLETEMEEISREMTMADILEITRVFPMELYHGLRPNPNLLSPWLTSNRLLADPAMENKFFHKIH